MFPTRSPRRAFRGAVVGLAVVVGAAGALAGGGTVAGASSPQAEAGVEGHDAAHMDSMDMAEMMGSMDVPEGAPMGRVHGEMVSQPGMARMHADMVSQQPGMGRMHADMVSEGRGRNG